VSGTLDDRYLGPGIGHAVTVKDANAADLQVNEYAYEFQDTRRSVYTPAFRNRRLELFEAFDFADINQTIGKRNTSTVSTQALYMLNHDFVMKQARLAAVAILADKTLLDDAARVRAAYQRSLGRMPTERELQISQDFVQSSPGDPADRREESWALLVQTLFASADFRHLE
jgi:hypothetical protein